MKTIDRNGLVELDIGLVKFILGSCPWMTEELETEIMGYVFVLEDAHFGRKIPFTVRS